jgi:hypothetical protein
MLYVDNRPVTGRKAIVLADRAYTEVKFHVCHV